MDEKTAQDCINTCISGRVVCFDQGAELLCRKDLQRRRMASSCEAPVWLVSRGKEPIPISMPNQLIAILRFQEEVKASFNKIFEERNFQII